MDAPKEAKPSYRVRAARKWRATALATRLFVARLPLRRYLRRVRLVHAPDDRTPLLSGFQIWVGRRLGWLVAGRDRAAEQLRIERSRLPERKEAADIVRALLRAQRGLLAVWLLAIVGSVGIDVLLHNVGGSVLDVFPGDEFLRDHLTLPSEQTIRDVLVATAAATGTILGLVLSVSLIVFQTTAERYQRSRIVEFLLRERVGSTVVRLLVLAFLFSLTLLLVGGVAADVTMYVGAVVAAGLAASGVVSLIAYRTHALAGYLPARLFGELSQEVSREMYRAAKPRAGRSIQGHSQRVVAADFATLEDLAERVVRENDEPSTAAGLDALGRPLNAYLRLKRRLPTESLWFPRRPRRLKANHVTSISDHMAGRGLMAPTNPEPDRDWFETRILTGIVRRLRDGMPADAVTAWEALGTLYLYAWQYAWASQEMAIVDAILSELEPIYRDTRVIDRPELVEQWAQGAWVILDVAAQGFSVSAQEIVETKPWANARFAEELPKLAAEEAAQLARKIRVELAVTGAVQTPLDRMASELIPHWSELEAKHREKYVERGYRLATTLLHAAASTRSSATPIAAEMFLRVLIRSVERGVARNVTQDAMRDLRIAVEIADAEAYDNLRDTLQASIRRLAEEPSWQQAEQLLTLYVACVLPEDRSHAGTDQDQLLTAVFDSLFLIAHFYGWAEFHQHSAGFRRASVLVEVVVRLDGLIELIGDHFASSLVLPSGGFLRYSNWFQSLRSSVHQLPDIWDRNGGIGYSTRKDHPSDLFSGSDLLGVGHDDTLEHLVHRLRDRRSALLARLIAALQARRADLSAKGES